MDRRPLASRETNWSKSLAKFLAKINLSPNRISLLSVVFSVFALIAFQLSLNQKYFLLLAAFFIQMRLICNLLDGMVAIEYNKKSIYGNLFNDVPDRFADVFIIMGAGIFSREISYFSLNGLQLAYINSILAVLTAYIRVLGVSVGTPMFFNGPMAKPQRMALLTVICFIQLIPGINFPLFYFSLLIMGLGQVLTIILRLKKIANSLNETRKL